MPGRGGRDGVLGEAAGITDPLGTLGTGGGPGRAAGAGLSLGIACAPFTGSRLGASLFP